MTPLSVVTFPTDLLRRNPRHAYVYIWRRGNTVLYVGLTGNPLARLGNHNVLGVAANVWKRDVVELQEYPEWRLAADEEIRLIRELRPKYNKTQRGRPDPVVRMMLLRAYGELRWVAERANAAAAS